MQELLRNAEEPQGEFQAVCSPHPLTHCTGLQSPTAESCRSVCNIRQYGMCRAQHLLQPLVGVLHIRSLEFRKPEPEVKRGGFGCGLVRTRLQGEAREEAKRTMTPRSTALHIKGFCADFACLFIL